MARFTTKFPKNEAGEELLDEKPKSYISVFELPSMSLCQDNDGHKTSIFIDGLKDFTWSPHKNVLVYTSFPEGDNVFPRVNFLEIPSRRVL